MPEGFSPAMYVGHRCHTNGKPREAWIGDGSKLEVPSLEGHADWAGLPPPSLANSPPLQSPPPTRETVTSMFF